MSEQPSEKASEGLLNHLRQMFLKVLDRGDNPWWQDLANHDLTWLDDARRRAWWNAAGERERAMWLTGELSRCRDILPDQYCELMKIPRGSTFADAVRHYEKDLRP